MVVLETGVKVKSGWTSDKCWLYTNSVRSSRKVWNKMKINWIVATCWYSDCHCSGGRMKQGSGGAGSTHHKCWVTLHKGRKGKEAFWIYIFEASKISSRGWIRNHATLPFKPTKTFLAMSVGKDRTKSFIFWSPLTNSLYYAIAVGNWRSKGKGHIFLWEEKANFITKGLF